MLTANCTWKFSKNLLKVVRNPIKKTFLTPVQDAKRYFLPEKIVSIPYLDFKICMTSF